MPCTLIGAGFWAANVNNLKTNIIMRIDELKSPYRELAEMRMQKHEGFINANYRLITAFDWISASEGVYFWNEVNKGKTPEIQQYSLDELKEWQSKQNNDWDTPFNTQALSASKDDKLFTAAVAAMQGMLGNEKLRHDIEVNRSTSENCSTLEGIAWSVAEALIKEGKERKHL